MLFMHRCASRILKGLFRTLVPALEKYFVYEFELNNVKLGQSFVLSLAPGTSLYTHDRAGASFIEDIPFIRMYTKHETEL